MTKGNLMKKQKYLYINTRTTIYRRGMRFQKLPYKARVGHEGCTYTKISMYLF